MKTIFTCLFIGLGLFVSAQQNTFKLKSFAQGGNNYLGSLIELNDGSFVAVGTGYDETLDAGLYLLKTDAQGNVLASELSTLDNGDYGGGIVKTTDGGFVVAGALGSKPALVKFNADLSIQWQRAYDFGENSVSVASVVQMADGSFAIGGSIDSIGDTESSFGFFFRTDSMGRFLFSKRYFTNAGPDIFDFVLTSDGNYGLLSQVFNNNSDTLKVMKVSPDGNVLWARKFYYRSANTEVAYLGASPDGGLLLTGSAFIGNDDNTELVMLKYTSNGNLSWSKTLASPGNAELDGYNVTVDRDGGYLFAGDYDTFTSDGDYDSSYGYVVKTDTAGNLLWTKTFEPSHEGYTELYQLIPAKDGGYAMCGATGYLDADTAVYEDGSFIYKFNGNFAICSEVPGNNMATLRNAGSSAAETIVPEDVAAADDTVSASFTDYGVLFNACSSPAFPVQLLSFTAALQGKSVSVNWTTANEINTDHFVVERSADRRTFAALQTVAARGNSSVVQSYSMNDLQPLPGTSYYRLKEVDKDGKVTYTSIVPVTVMSNGTIVISPNPVQSVMHVIVQSIGSNNLTLQVVDMKGNVLATQNRAVGAGRNQIDIAASSLTKGVYILKVTDSRTTQAIRFVKE